MTPIRGTVAREAEPLDPVCHGRPGPDLPGRPRGRGVAERRVRVRGAPADRREPSLAAPRGRRGRHRRGRPARQAPAPRGRGDALGARARRRRHAHCERAGQRRADPVEPTDFEYGERQYAAEDPAGHRWTFSETLEDVDPATWGGTLHAVTAWRPNIAMPAGSGDRWAEDYERGRPGYPRRGRLDRRPALDVDRARPRRGHGQAHPPAGDGVRPRDRRRAGRRDARAPGDALPRGPRRERRGDPARRRFGRRGLRSRGVPLVRLGARPRGDRTGPATRRRARPDVEPPGRADRAVDRRPRPARARARAARPAARPRRPERRPLRGANGVPRSRDRRSRSFRRRGYRTRRRSTARRSSPSSRRWAGSATSPTTSGCLCSTRSARSWRRTSTSARGKRTSAGRGCAASPSTPSSAWSARGS